MIRLTPATEDDLPGILEIEQEAISPPWTHGALLSEIYRDDSFFTVAYGATANSEKTTQSAGKETKDGGRDSCGVSGFVILRRMADEGELLQIAVNKTVRRCGVADTLMEAALRYSSEQALKTVFLEARRSNEAAIALYKKHGFMPVSHRRDYYSSPAEDAIVLKKEL